MQFATAFPVAYLYPITLIMVDYSSDIRFRIILVHYIVPMVMYTIAMVCFSFDDTITNVVFGAFLLLAFGLKLSLSRGKYLYSFDYSAGTFEIGYYNIFLKRKVVQVSADQVEGITTHQTDPLTQWPTLKIRVGNKWQKYLILSKGLRNAARLFFSTVSIGS